VLAPRRWNCCPCRTASTSGSRLSRP